jgi:hypothetical protein
MIRKVDQQKGLLLRIATRQAHGRWSRWTAQFLILLALSSLGCARGDWTTEILTLVDVAGTWEGPFRFGAGATGNERITRWVLQQNGGKVRGEAQGPDGTPAASIEGVVNGEVFRWELTGPFIRFSASNLVSGTWRGETTVNGDEMIGRADGHLCPCTFHLRRVDTQATREKQPQ